MTNSAIQNYIETEFRHERSLVERRRKSLPGVLRCRLMELYWTGTRLLGLAHLHDGSISPQATAANARKNLHLFPVGAAARKRAAPGDRLLIDVTATISSGRTTGIQRVVRQLAGAAVEQGVGIPVFIQNGRLLSHIRDAASADEIEIVRGDKFVMADASWHDTAAHREVMDKVTASGGENVLILHDIIQLRYPELYPRDFYPDLVAKFADWFDTVVIKSDVVIADSKHVAEDFRSYVVAHEKPTHPGLRIDWNHLGADFEIRANETISQRVATICAGAPPFFLSVGTLEPRKGVRVALNAFESLWRQGIDVRYVIAGRGTPCTRALTRDIVAHQEYGRRLFWLDHASNADLRQLYQNARSLIFSSVVEGFGLPLVEAAYFALPAIASDIPIFREIGGGAVTYFEVANSESLADRVQEALATPKSGNAMPILTWRAATDNLLRKIKNAAGRGDAIGQGHAENFRAE